MRSRHLEIDKSRFKYTRTLSNCQLGSKNGVVTYTRHGVTTRYKGDKVILDNDVLFIDGKAVTPDDPRIIREPENNSSKEGSDSVDIYKALMEAVENEIAKCEVRSAAEENVEAALKQSSISRQKEDAEAVQQLAKEDSAKPMPISFNPRP